MKELFDKISSMVEAEATAFGLFLTGREREGQSNFIFFMDSETVLNMKTLTDFTRHISNLIDEGDFDETPFTFEISSPGAERPLTDSRQFHKHCGRRFSITTDQNDTFEARLIGVPKNLEDLTEHWNSSWEWWLAIQKPAKLRKEPKKKIHRRFDEDPEENPSSQNADALPKVLANGLPTITKTPDVPRCSLPALIMEKFIPEKGKKTRSEIVAIEFATLKQATIILSFK